MSNKINWAVIGPGRIAKKFGHDLGLVADGNLEVVASRSMDRAANFAREYNAGKAYDSYESVIRHRNIDIAYIGTPHSFHLEQTLMCLENGIAVLCEKPASLNQKEVQQMVDAAQHNNTFFMEALWTRFLPSMKKVIEIVESGEMGEVVQIEAEFCFTAPIDPLSRLYNMSLGGGSILDIGIYPAFLAYLLLGKPPKITATGQLSSTGSDQTCSMTFDYGGGKMATLHSSVVTDSQMPARITMSKGYILMQPRWHESTEITVIKAGEDPYSFSLPLQGMGFVHEIVECHNCLKKGLVQSQLWSHNDSLNLIEILDQVRKQVGVHYPGRD